MIGWAMGAGIIASAPHIDVTLWGVAAPPPDGRPRRYLGPMTREATAQPAPAPRASRPTTVLVIEDEPQIRRVVRAALEDEATSVLNAGTGADGIALCTAERPDVIVLDLGLPDTNGEAVCRALRERTPAPIVVLSARHSEAQKVALLNAGADDYVTKPFGSEEFRARIRAQVRRASAASSCRPTRRSCWAASHSTSRCRPRLATRSPSI